MHPCSLTTVGRTEKTHFQTPSCDLAGLRSSLAVVQKHQVIRSLGCGLLPAHNIATSFPIVRAERERERESKRTKETQIIVFFFFSPNLRSDIPLLLLYSGC